MIVYHVLEIVVQIIPKQKYMLVWEKYESMQIDLEYSGCSFSNSTKTKLLIFYTSMSLKVGIEKVLQKVLHIKKKVPVYLSIAVYIYNSNHSKNITRSNTWWWGQGVQQRSWSSNDGSDATCWRWGWGHLGLHVCLLWIGEAAQGPVDVIPWIEISRKRGAAE